MSPQDFSPIVTLTNLEVEGEDCRLSSEPSNPQEVNQEGREFPDQQSDTFAPASPLGIALDVSPIPVVDWIDRVDVYADRLMDEIFNPVEHTLESGAAPLEFEETEVLRIRSLEMPNLSLPASLVPRMDAYSPQADSALAVVSAEEMAAPSPLIDRLLLGSVLVSCAITLGWWAIDRDRYDVFLSASPEAPLSVPEPATVSPDTQFAAYLQDSLKTLDTQTQGKSASNPAETAPAGTTLPSVPATLPTVPDTATATLPTVTVPGTPSLGDLSPLPAPAAPSTVLDRVYIPVYPNTPGVAAPPSAVASSLPGVLNPAPPLVAAGNVPKGNIPAAAPLAAAPVAAPSQTTPTPQKPAVAPVPQPSVTHSLVGILELGDQSAALFQVNGVTRRVHLGEAIGSAGWTLVEVGNQEAIIRRNGEVRSIYIGQNF